MVLPVLNTLLIFINKFCGIFDFDIKGSLTFGVECYII